MSKYENYNVVSSYYDNVRFSVGIDVVSGMVMVHSNKRKEDMRVLDAGCGTGNPAKSLTQYGFRHLTLMDASSGMLNKAKEKLADEISKGVVENVVEATLPEMPFSDKSFDMVLFSVVLHHLDKSADGINFPGIQKTLEETKRVLKSDGVLIIISPTPYSMREGIWWMSLLPEVTERYLKRFPTVEQWERMLAVSKFRCLNKVNILGHEVFGPAYMDSEGPLKKEWRNGVSYWATATEEEIQTLESKVNRMKTEGTLEQYMKDHDKTNDVGGMSVFVCANA